MSVIQISKESTFLFENINSFFNPSEVIDYFIGKKAKMSLQIALALFEQNQYKLESLAYLIYYIFKEQKDNHFKFVLKEDSLEELLQNDGLKLLMAGVNRLLQKMLQKDGASLQNEIALKVLLNLIYVSITYIEQNKSKVHSSQDLNQKYRDYKFDDILMKIITLSLEAHYIPIKKIVMLYAKVLANLFHYKTAEERSAVINPVYLFRDQTVIQLPLNNLLKYGELQKHKTSSPPPVNPLLKEKVNSIEKFYRKHNSGECPLAQSIVVGLLRSLLTICNCQKHKKFQTNKGAGVDSFRQWQISYRYLFEHPEIHSQFPQWIIQKMRAYDIFDQDNGQPQKGSTTFEPLQFQIWSQFYTHKIYTTTAITNFFFLILIALKENMFIQYSYFLQLISDANGILVFLKFLTDKFGSLQSIKETIVFSNKYKKDEYFNFKGKAMLAIYGVLQMLYASCNNYPEKIRTFLFDYNSHFIIKKIPTLFIAKNTMKDEELNSSSLGMPSKEEINNLSQEPEYVIFNKLTELCYDLLKIQIPFFSKKKKEDSSNMKMIIDIYCKYPKVNQPQELSSFQKLLLKTKSALVKQEKYITSVQQMKTIHNEYNNLYYWSNDFLNNDIRTPSAQKNHHHLEKITNAEEWLEQNLWKYYD